MDNLFAWSESNKNHLSVGVVLVKDNKVLVHKLARIGDKYFLPKKTHSNNLTIEQTLHKVENETGYRVDIQQYLGSRQSTFPVESGEIINKTTLYFLCSEVEQTQRDTTDRDADSQLEWKDVAELISIMREQGKEANDLDESEILEKL